MAKTQQLKNTYLSITGPLESPWKSPGNVFLRKEVTPARLEDTEFTGWHQFLRWVPLTSKQNTNSVLYGRNKA